MLKNYYGMKINRLCEAVMSLNEKSVDYILANATPEEINAGVTPLYFIDYNRNENTNEQTKEKMLRIFEKILNHEKFTNVNTIFHDGNYTSTLLDHLLYYTKYNNILEDCAVMLINSPKYKLIDYPSNYEGYVTSLKHAANVGSSRAVKAILDHKDFTKVDYDYNVPDLYRKCKKIMDSNNLYKLPHIIIINMFYFCIWYNKNIEEMDMTSVDSNVIKELTYIIKVLSDYFKINRDEYLRPIVAACSWDINKKNNPSLLEIIKHPKFTNTMLLNNIKPIARTLTDDMAYEIFRDNKKVEGTSKECYDEILYNAINYKQIGLAKALIENDNINFSEKFFSFYHYYLRNTIHASSIRGYSINYNIVNNAHYSKQEVEEICKLIEEKEVKEINNNIIDLSNYIELTDKDYTILKAGMACYNMITDSANYEIADEQLLKKLSDLLFYDDDNEEIGPFFNIYDPAKVWKFFTEYNSFERYRDIIKQHHSK